MDDQDQIPVQELNDKLQFQIPMDNFCRAVLYTAIVSISALNFGYCLTLISSSSLPMLIHYYNITASKTVALSLLNGSLPIGGVVGALVVPYVLPFTTKRQIHYYLTIGTIVACGISVIPMFQMVLIGRFILGGLISIFLSVSAGYIKQTFPVYIRKPMSAIYSCGRVTGILLCYVIAYISKYSQDQTEHVVIFFGPAYFSILQSFLVWKFLPESVTQMVKKDNLDQAKKTLYLLYSIENVQKRLTQIQNELKAHVRMTIRYQQLNFFNRKNLTSIHLAFLRHFCGMSYIVVYAGQVVSTINVTDSKTTAVIVNSVQLAANIFGIFLLQKISRSSMLFISSWLMGVIR